MRVPPPESFDLETPWKTQMLRTTGGGLPDLTGFHKAKHEVTPRASFMGQATMASSRGPATASRILGHIATTRPATLKIRLTKKFDL